MKTAIFIDELFLKHDTGAYHPETAERLIAIRRHFEKKDLIEKFIFLPKRFATKEEIGLVHHSSYIDYVQEMAQKGGGYLDGDTPVSSYSFEAATLAAGSGLEAVDQILNEKIQKALLLIRPPGHHSLRSRGMGFCLFNNIAITARYLLQKGIHKVAILDWDVHHGNGTQDEFYADPNVLFISIHQYPFYPGTGSEQEIGEKEGKGFTFNIPMARGSSDSDYKKAFREKILPRLETFEPEWILISSGFDAHTQDPLGGIELSTSMYEWMTEKIMHFAHEYCKGRVISFLEGGYSLPALAESVGVHGEVLLSS